jgi:hypothetical protein
MKMKKKSGRFWITDDFIRKHAKKYSVHQQMVYVVLCCHANKEKITFIGCRKIAECIGISKNTAYKAIKELEASHLVRRLDKNIGKPSHIKIFDVPGEGILPYQMVGPKESNKESIKEDIKNNNKSYKGKEKAMEALKEANPVVYECLYGDVSDEKKESQY